VGFPIDTTLTDGEQILQVTSMRFNRPDLSLGTPAPEGFSLGSLDFMRIAEIVVLFITALLVILLVARPLVQGAIGNVSGGRTAALAGPGAMPENVQALLGNSEGGMMLPEEPSADDHIDVAQIEGQVKKSSVRKVAALVEQHPDESMSILRTWMHEGE
jgi:flagellar M-ring protein FliF